MEKLLTFQGSLGYNQLKEVVANTPPDISNEAFVDELRKVTPTTPNPCIEISLLQTTQGKKDKKKAAQIEKTPKEKAQEALLEAKRARHNENISLYKGFGGRCRY